MLPGTVRRSPRGALVIATLVVAACGAAAPAPASTSPGPSDLVGVVKRGDTARARALLEGGADPSARGLHGDSALMLAVLYGDAELVKLLLDRKAEARHRNAFGATALHYAVSDLDQTRALVAAGADVNAVDRAGYTPLMLAALRDDGGPVVRFLLERGADPRHVATGNLGAVTLAGGGDADTLQALFDRGADPREKTSSGHTALHAAASRGNLAGARLLLDRGADIDARDRMGRTPLMWAAQMGRGDVVALLLERGADTNVIETFSETSALMQAAASDRAGEGIVKALLAARADIAPLDEEGASAATWAARRGDPGIVRALARAPRGAAPALTAEGDTVGAANTTKQALTRAIPLLEKSRPAFRKVSGCPSCHHDAQPAMALARAANRGYVVDQAARVTEARATIEALRQSRDRYLEGVAFADVAEPAYLLVGLDASGYAPDEMTGAMARYLVLRQSRQGSWRTQMQRLPVDGSDVSFTALAVRSLELYAPASRAADTSARVARARGYLESVDAADNEDLTYKALGLRWAGAPEAAIASTLARLVARQREDGGFAQRDALASDAYATAQAIVALRDAGGVPASAPAIQRAVRFLLADQRTDGSWFVASRALPFQPFFESGFPQGRSQYMSASATAWAVLALAACEGVGGPRFALERPGVCRLRSGATATRLPLPAGRGEGGGAHGSQEGE